ncbi:MAG: hypothetical protein ACSHYA_07500 [Opitutaceae bacterium]
MESRQAGISVCRRMITLWSVGVPPDEPSPSPSLTRGNVRPEAYAPYWAQRIDPLEAINEATGSN